MAGLTEEDLLSLDAPSSKDVDEFVLATQANERALGPKESPEEVRARMIRKDIFHRHGIPMETPDDEAASLIMQSAMSKGLIDKDGRGTGAWANPQEREAAQRSYVAAGGASAYGRGVRQDNAKYLMDPQTAAYMQGYQRDMDFLSAAGRQPDAEVSAWAGKPDPAAFRRSSASSALDRWDKSNGKQVSRDAWNSPNYGAPNEFMDSVSEAISNPDLPVASYMHNVNIPYEAMALKFGGEAGSFGEALQGARGNANMTMRYRPNAVSPVLDVADSASPSERASRIRELRTLNEQAAIPKADERWERTTGWTPPAWLSDAGDLAMQMVDPTIAIPVGGFAAAALKQGIKAAAKPAALGLLKDFAQEQATGAGLLAGFGGSSPGRAWLGDGGYLDMTPPDAKLKDPSELAAAREARQKQFEMMQKERGENVSSPRTVAYNR